MLLILNKQSHFFYALSFIMKPETWQKSAQDNLQQTFLLSIWAAVTNTANINNIFKLSYKLFLRSNVCRSSIRKKMVNNSTNIFNINLKFWISLLALNILCIFYFKPLKLFEETFSLIHWQLFRMPFYLAVEVMGFSTGQKVFLDLYKSSQLPSVVKSIKRHSLKLYNNE